jgi:error-prone DNA polymerase
LPHQHVAEPARLPLLCESREGYQNLCQLVTRFKMRETAKQEGAANFDDLEQYASGLVCLTGGDEGPLAAALMRGGEEAGGETVERLVRIFGPRQRLYRAAAASGARRGVAESGRRFGSPVL